MAQTIFERVGGFAKVRKIVSAFYDRILEEPTLQHYFEKVAMPRLIDHQTQFISAVMGGPASHNDEALRRVHAPHSISRTDFKKMAEILRNTLEDFDVQPDDVNQVMGEIMRREVFIITRQD
jgi:hemoglobin